MIRKYEKFRRDYLKLRNEIDDLALSLEKLHFKHLKCRAGCDLCCMDYSIFPVEFSYILNELKKEKLTLLPANHGKNNACIFLEDHTCSIYEHRPVICRTHGLPLLYMNENNEWELSICELNFTDYDLNEFTTKNTYPQDRYNSKLFLLNKNFIDETNNKQYRETDLIPIKELAEYLTRSD